MFKSKDTRDTLLLIFMALIIIAFLVYIFIPKPDKPVSPVKSDKTDKTGQTDIVTENPTADKKIDKKVLPLPQETLITELPEETVPSEAAILEEYNQRLESELKTVASSILGSTTPFQSYNVDALKAILTEPGNTLVEKLCKFSFFDLDDILRIDFPESYSNSLRFNLFVSLFLVKIQEDLVEKAFESLQKVELQKLVNFDIYNLLNKEIEKEYQVLPLLFYFKHLMRQVNIFPAEDKTLFFKRGCHEIRDLTETKYLVKILDLLGYSRQKESFRIEWREEDGVFSDDKKIYKSLYLTVNRFLKQKYLLFPDPENSGNNIWIKDLCKSDPGDIELEFLELQNEDPSRRLSVQKIIYTPINNRFVVLLEGYPSPGKEDILERLIWKRLEDFQKSFIIIDFALKKVDTKSFNAALKRFGQHLKKNIREVY